MIAKSQYHTIIDISIWPLKCGIIGTIHVELRVCMPEASKEQISAYRVLLQNPYACLDDTGGFSAAAQSDDASPGQIAADRRRLENQYAHLDGQGRFSATTPPQPPFTQGARTRRRHHGSSRTGQYWQIEQAAKKLQREIWDRRHEFWPEGVPTDPTELLDPAIGLRLRGFDCDLVDTLGQYSNDQGIFEVAGTLDRQSNRVRLSRRLPFNTRAFTAAHELGHVILHQDIRMHRDRPLDGSQLERSGRDPIEIEADKFASFFLMPEKLLRIRFRQLFLCEKFTLNEATVFALDPSDRHQLLSGKKPRRELARILAGATSFNGQYFPSLAEQFKVSIEAMAIRIEELDLLDA